MILSDGTDTREAVRGSAKFGGDQFTFYLWLLGTNGDNGDDYDTHPVLSEGWSRYGRRFLCWDDQGFVWSYRADTLAEAEERAEMGRYDWEEEEAD